MHSKYELTMTPETYGYALDVLGETNDVRESCVNEVYAWLKDNPQIKANPQPREVLFFLRGAKFNMTKAMCKIESYYRMRIERTEWFSNRDPFLKNIEFLLDLGVFLPLMKRDTENRLVVVIRTAAHDPKKCDQNDVFKVGKMILDLALSLDETISVYGVVAIFDMRNVTLGHALALPPTLIKRSVESWENYPCMTKKLIFVNAPMYLNALLNVFRTFMSAKMKSRIIVTGSVDKFVSPSILPNDLGGTGDSYSELAVHWKDMVQKNNSWYSDEPRLRPTNAGE